MPLDPTERAARLRALRAKIADSLAAKRSLGLPSPAPRYDDVFLDGTRWLGTL